MSPHFFLLPAHDMLKKGLELGVEGKKNKKGALSSEEHKEGHGMEQCWCLGMLQEQDPLPTSSSEWQRGRTGLSSQQPWKEKWTRIITLVSMEIQFSFLDLFSWKHQFPWERSQISAFQPNADSSRSSRSPPSASLPLLPGWLLNHKKQVGASYASYLQPPLRSWETELRAWTQHWDIEASWNGPCDMGMHSCHISADGQQHQFTASLSNPHPAAVVGAPGAQRCKTKMPININSLLVI